MARHRGKNLQPCADLIADTGVFIPPPGMTDAEIAAGLQLNARRIRARRILAQAEAIALGMGNLQGEALINLQVDAGRDRDEAEIDAAKSAMAAAAARMVQSMPEM